MSHRSGTPSVSDPTPAPPLDDVRAQSGIMDAPPYSHITFAIVVWNDADRLLPLLKKVRPYFETLAVVVQDSPDDTLRIARGMADIVVEDQHHGYGDASFGPKLLPKVRTPWTLKLDADEWPSEDLLVSLSSATWYAQHVAHTGGVWIPFRSWVEGQEYTEQHSHLRLFTTSAGWPGTLHSRPPIDDGIWWPTGHISHTRSMDEVVRDYMNYLEIGKADRGWTAHNRAMIRGACEAGAASKGWAYVKAFPWWPDVKAAVFEEEP